MDAIVHIAGDRSIRVAAICESLDEKSILESDRHLLNV